jgi:two-component system chemotaxis response regulator CheB
VVLTGAGSDGVAGIAAIRQRGGFVLVEQPRTAQAASLPAHALETGQADLVLPLEQIGPFLRRILEMGVK